MQEGRSVDGILSAELLRTMRELYSTTYEELLPAFLKGDFDAEW